MPLNSLAKLLPDFNRPEEIALRSQRTLRISVGALGMMLPIFLYLFLQITNNFAPILPSISHYYYTRANCFFLIIVSLLAIFLIIYKGYDAKDFVTSNLAGLSALLMLIFPTDNLFGLMDGIFDPVAVTKFDGSSFRPKFHFICAAIFLLSLAYMAFFLFTKSDTEYPYRTNKKKIRNVIYRTCAIIMVMALLIAFMGFTGIINKSFYDANKMTFWMEFVTVEAFGFAWLVKGQVFFSDSGQIP
jgi:hypothetical protein